MQRHFKYCVNCDLEDFYFNKSLLDTLKWCSDKNNWWVYWFFTLSGPHLRKPIQISTLVIFFKCHSNSDSLWWDKVDKQKLKISIFLGYVYTYSIPISFLITLHMYSLFICVKMKKNRYKLVSYVNRLSRHLTFSA